MSEEESGGAPRSGSSPEEAAAPEPAPPQRRPAPPDPLGLDEVAETVPPAPRGGGRALAALALLLALVGAAGSGYLYYVLIHRGDARVAGRLDAVETRLEARLGELEQRLDGRLRDIDARQRETLDSVVERQEASRQAQTAALDAALQAALDKVNERLPPSSGVWREAEVGYLLRIANQRLLMERDVAGALELLRAADDILAEIDDFALHPVRAELAAEIAALEGVRELDLPGVFLRLEAAKRQLGELPLQVPRYGAAAETAPSAAVAEPAAAPEAGQAPGILAELKRQFAGLLRVRRLDSDARPLLAPREGLYLALNLRLMLERAQLAAMNREPLMFRESLADAGDWVRRYFQGDDPAVRRLLGELAALEALELDQPLPDVSGSLDALEQVQRAPLPESP